MKKKKKRIYKTGGAVNNYIQSPADALIDNQADIAGAKLDATTNPLTQTMHVIGSMLMQNSGQFGNLNLGGGGMGDFSSGFGDMGAVDDGTRMAAFGGIFGPGDGKKKKEDKDITKAANEATGLAFDETTANRLFEFVDPAQANTEKRSLDLGKYKGREYFNIKDQGSNFVVNPTSSNPQNAQGYKKMMKYIKKLNPDANIADNGYLQFKERMAFGGTADGVAIEAEGKEVVETPDGFVGELEGPSHENGGIDMLVPPGTEIFSDRLTGPDGKTMAERKKAREKSVKKYEKLLEKSPSDITLKKTLERVSKNNERQEEADMAKMELAQMATQMLGMMMTGGTVKKYAPGGTVEEDEGNMFSDIFGNMTFGDLVGMYGNISSTFDPMKNTLEQRAGDTPNINAYKDYGVEGLEALDKTKDYVAGQRDNNLQDLELARTSALKRGRNSARGVNTQRALDISTDQSINDSKSKVYNQFSQMMQQILGQEAQMENQQDAYVMQGEQAKDLADRQDRDNYFSQMAQDIATRGTGLQKIGKDINTMKSRASTQQALGDLYENYSMDGMTGEISFEEQEAIKNNSNYFAIIQGHPNSRKALDGVSKGIYVIRDNRLFDKEGNEVNIDNI